MESLKLNDLNKSPVLDLAKIEPQPPESTIKNEGLAECKNEILQFAECNTKNDAISLVTHALQDLNAICFEIKLNETLKPQTDKNFLSFMKEIDHNRLILIIFELFSGFFIFWKLAGSKTFFYLKLDVNQAELVEFIKQFIVTSIKINHNGLLSEYKYNSQSFLSDIKLYSMSDRRGLNLLSLAAESGNIQAVKSLLKLGFDVQISVDDRTAADFAYQKKHSDCLLELLKANSLYPTNFKSVDVSNEVNAFIKISTNLHSAIKSKNEAVVNQILTSNPNLRHFYDTANNSAITHALINNVFKIYEMFLIKNIHFGPQEDIDGIFDQLDYKSCEKLREIHEKHSQSLIQKHLIILMANSSIGHDTKNDQEKLNAVTKVFNVLDKDHRLSLILKVVAATRKFQITFDFKRETIGFLDPTSEPYANGIFYSSGRILIGAKQLLEPGNEHIVYGVLAHELCHLALFKVYENMAKPYHKDDKKDEKIFDNIVKEFQRKIGVDEIIDVVFDCYPPELQHAELIVRIPHMIGHYLNDEETLSERKITMGSLLNYFDEKPMKAMEKALSELEKNAEKDIKGKFLKAKKKISRMKKIILILSILLLFGIPFAAYYFAGPTKKWNDLSPEEKLTVKNSNVTYHDVFVRFGDLFAENSTAYGTLDAYNIDSALKNKPEGLNEAISQTLHHEVFLVWENSTKSLKEKILKSRINFQGEKIILNQILSENSKSLSNFTSSQVKLMHSNDVLSIGSKLTPSYKFFVERNFTISSGQRRMKRETLVEENFNHTESNLPNYCKNEIKESKRSKVVEKSKEGQITETMVINSAIRDGIFILSDSPGSGKSTVFEHLAISTKKIIPFRYVTFIRLRDYVKVYQKNLHKDFTEIEAIADLIGDEILRLENETLSIFKELFLQDKVVILWDALDEAGGGKFVNFSISLFSKIYKRTKNLQFISTRPENLEDLTQELHINTHKLIPYDRESRSEHLSKLFVDLPSDKLKLLMSKMQRFITSIENSWTDKKSVNNPLMLQLISEVIRDDEEIDLNNRFLVYRKFFQKKINSITENHLKECASFGVDFLTIYQIYALKLIVPDSRQHEELDFEVTSLEIFQNEDRFDQKRAICQGILTFSSNSLNLEFIHRTFAEYFTAEFLIDSFNNIRESTTESEIAMRLKVLLVCIHSDMGVLDFLSNFFEYEKSNELFGIKLNSAFKDLITTKYKTILKPISSALMATKYDRPIKVHEIVRRFFLHCEDITKAAILYRRKSIARWMEIIFEINLKTEFDSSEFYTESHQVGHIFFKIWFHTQTEQETYSDLIRQFTNIPKSNELFNKIKNSRNFIDFYEVVKDHLTDKDESEMYVRNYHDIFLIILQNSPDFEYFFMRFTNCSTKKEISMKLNDRNYMFKNKNILHVIAQMSNSKRVEIMLALIEKYLNYSDISQRILDRTSNDLVYTPLDYACKNKDEEVLNVYWRFIKKYLSEESQKKHLKDESEFFWNNHAAPLRHCRKAVFDDIISDDEYKEFCSKKFTYIKHMDAIFINKKKVDIF